MQRSMPQTEKSEKTILLPEKRLAEIKQRFPSLWKEVDACRAELSRSWPNWCFIPKDKLEAILDPYLPTGRNDDQQMENYYVIRLVTVLTPWRASRNVYRFDPDIYQALIKTSLKGKLPLELLRKLPEWSVYIETPGLLHPSGTAVEGFAASMNYTWNNDVVLYFVPFSKDKRFIRGFPLSEDLTIEEAVKKTVDDYHAMIGDMNLSKHGNRINPEDEISFVSTMVNLLLYICQSGSEYLDVRCADGTDRLPARPSPKKTKKGLRHFPPKRLTVWECGFRQGAEIRRALSERSEHKGGTHRSPIPHTRAAHWHTYIVGKGSRKDPSKGRRVLKWIHTVLVNAAKSDGEVPEIPASA